MQCEMCQQGFRARVPRRAASLASIVIAFAAVMACGILGSPLAHAVPLIVSDPFLQYYNVVPTTSISRPARS